MGVGGVGPSREGVASATSPIHAHEQGRERSLRLVACACMCRCTLLRPVYDKGGSAGVEEE